MGNVPRIVQLMQDRPREFTPAEKALIRKVHGYMPAQQLLDILNERLACDRGPFEIKHSMEQLHAEIGTAESSPGVEHDRAGLRRVIATARRAGVLHSITRQVIDDFAVVFSLSPGQVLRLHDILLQAKEEAES